MLLLAAAACTGDATPSVTTVPAALASSVPPPPGAPTLAATTTTDAAGRCFPDSPARAQYVSAGVVGTAGGPGGDARLVAAVGIDSPRAVPGAEPACERLAVDLATADGAPATGVGIVEVELLTRAAVLRMRLTSLVSDTAVADVVLDGALIRRAFVIRDGDGLTVDVHLGAAVDAAVVPGRGRVLVDLRRTGDLPPGTAVAGAEAAILQPAGTVGSYPLLVTGYGRSRSGEIEVAITGPDGEVRETVPVPSYPWGWFELVVVDGPTGTVEVSAGDAVQTVLLG